VRPDLCNFAREQVGTHTIAREVHMKRVAQAFVLLVVVAVPAFAGGPPSVITTPEPATLGLVATGVGVLGAVRWWRKRR
jgi:hypothetical protein